MAPYPLIDWTACSFTTTTDEVWNAWVIGTCTASNSTSASDTNTVWYRWVLDLGTGTICMENPIQSLWPDFKLPPETEEHRLARVKRELDAQRRIQELEARRMEIDIRMERLRLEMENAAAWAQLEYLIPKPPLGLAKGELR